MESANRADRRSDQPKDSGPATQLKTAVHSDGSPYKPVKKKRRADDSPHPPGVLLSMVQQAYFLVSGRAMDSRMAVSAITFFIL